MASRLRYPGKMVIMTGGKHLRHWSGHRERICSPKWSSVQNHLKRLILVTVERYGCLDCLVNSAGDGHAEEVDDVTAQDFRSLMELNVVSKVLASKYALPYLWEMRGNIINIGCDAGIFGMKNTVSFTSTMGAIIAMTKALAIDESKYKVRVNCISHGNVWAPLWERHANQFLNPEAVIQEGKSFELMGCLGTPEEVALAALFLATDGTFCTGFDLTISGGAEVGFGVKNQVDLEPGQCPSGYSQGSSVKQ